MHDDSILVEARIERFVREKLAPATYRALAPLTVTAWQAPGEPVPFAEAVTQHFEPFAIGTAWGAPWGTTWFHVSGTIPEGWGTDSENTRIEVVIDLGFNATVPGFQVEGTAYSVDGTILKAVESLNRRVPLNGAPGTHVELYIEAASNPDLSGGWLFAPSLFGDKETAGNGPLYTLRQVDVGLLDTTVWELRQDIWTLDGLRRELPATLSRRAEILRALERCVEVVDPDAVAQTASAGRLELAPVLARPANASAHRLHAVGHAHIDCAWLWPVRETVRKVARTFSNVLTLIEENPDFVFAASSAQQYAWLQQYYPELFARVKAAVAAGNFVPVGGMWVESDTNMPGGEALARQFVAGKRFFMEELGVEPLDVWLPDSFGYSGALPQIAKAAGSRWFLTQKISWNDTNMFPHHTFRWEGIDGSRIFTHFPPVADYNAQLTGAELARAERVFAEKGYANTSLIPFGWGDGGGGPTREMIAAARRTKSLEGSPTVELSSPQRFFEVAEAEYPEPPVWSGELYLEFHRGTYTSQARSKRGNRRSEHLLREAELWATTAAVRSGAEYPTARLTEAWHTVLLQQFHDILPGTSIAWVHREAERNYAVVAESLESLIDTAVRACAGSGEHTLRLNAGPYALDGVPALAGVVSTVDASFGGGSAHSERTPEGTVLRNDFLAVTIDHDGLISSLYDRVAHRELVPAGTRGGRLLLHRDTPSKWDAWELDADYRRTVTPLTAVSTIEPVSTEPGAVGVRVSRQFGASTVAQTIMLAGHAATIDITFDIDWHERQKILRFELPLDVHAERAASEIQFGHIYRPTHTNTSWEVARFETVAHRWVHVGESGYGVAVANDSTYGHSIGRAEDAGGSVGTTIGLSLLRAPLYPDPDSDQGHHEMRVSVQLGATVADAIAEGYRLNLPLRTVSGVGCTAIDALFEIDNPAVVIEAVKLAEDASGDVIVRLYEAHGSRTRATLTRNFEAVGVVETDLLERPLSESAVGLAPDDADDHLLTLQLRPFQLVTLRFGRR